MTAILPPPWKPLMLIVLTVAKWLQSHRRNWPSVNATATVSWWMNSAQLMLHPAVGILTLIISATVTAELSFDTASKTESNTDIEPRINTSWSSLRHFYPSLSRTLHRIWVHVRRPPWHHIHYCRVSSSWSDRANCSSYHCYHEFHSWRYLLLM